MRFYSPLFSIIKRPVILTSTSQLHFMKKAIKCNNNNLRLDPKSCVQVNKQKAFLAATISAALFYMFCNLLIL